LLCLPCSKPRLGNVKFHATAKGEQQTPEFLSFLFWHSLHQFNSHDPSIDEIIADPVLRMHRWRNHVIEVRNSVYLQSDPLLPDTGDDGFLPLDFPKVYFRHETAPPGFVASREG
jgi:hypothetical protein